MSILSRGPSRLVKNVPVVVAAVVLVVAMVADTKFLTSAESAAKQPVRFSAKTYAAKTFPRLAVEIGQKATDITVLAPAADRNLAAAGGRYGNDLGAGQFAFPVKASGKVTQADADFLVLSVPGLPAKDTVRIPLAMAINGIPVRDATGSVKFGDFTDQSDYQSVANEFGLIIATSILAPLHPASLKGKSITVVGAWGSGGPPNSYILQPVSIKVAP